MKKNKLKNGIMIAAMAVVMTITGLGIAEKSAMAANTSDTSWSFSLAANSSTRHLLSARQKQDSSSIYFYWSSSYGGTLSALYVTPYGYDSNGNLKGAASRSYQVSDYPVNSTGKYSVTNYVYETGMATATLGIKSKTGYGTAVGKWSPDSAGTYTRLQ